MFPSLSVNSSIWISAKATNKVLKTKWKKCLSARNSRKTCNARK
jgi:hypothetical protein